MTDPGMLEAELWRVAERLEAVSAAISERSATAARAEHAYKVKHALEFVAARAQGQPVAQCENLATIACDLELIARLEADALLDSAKEAGRNARARAEVLRSINSNHRTIGG